MHLPKKKDTISHSFAYAIEVERTIFLNEYSD